MAPLNGSQLQVKVSSLAMDDQRTLAILKQHLPKLEAARWDDLNSNEVWLAADEAVSVEMADAIADFAPPVGTALWDFNFLQT